MAVVVFGFLYDFLDHVPYTCEDRTDYNILQFVELTKLKINDIVSLVEAFKPEVDSVWPGVPVL